MPLFIMIPNNLNETLEKNQASAEIINGLHQALEHIKSTIETQSELKNMGKILHSLGFKKKKFEKKIVYTVNVGVHRFIFEKLSGDAGIFFVLRNVALHHDYTKALRWVSLGSIIGSVTENFLHNQSFITFAYSGHHYDESALDQEQVIVHYGREYISLSNIQTSVLNQTTFPQLLIGPPGSGKTLLIHALFQEQVLQYMQDESRHNKHLHLLYLTKNSALVESLKQSWKTWQETVFSKASLPFGVEFKTVDEFNEAYIEKHLTDTERNIVSKEDYLKKLKNVLKQKKWKKVTLSPERVLQEINHSAYVLNTDYGKTFETSNYQNLGVNQITVTKECQEDVFKLFKNIDLKMVSSLSISTFPEEEKYDLVCVDESQQLSLQQLSNALTVTENGQVLYCGDSNQRGEVIVPSLPLFVHHMRSQGYELYQTTLPSSHRLKPRAARLVSELIKLEGTLRGGLVDNTAYASLVSAHIEESDDSVCWVDEFTSDYTRLKNKASFAVLVLTQSDINTAVELTGCDTVMLADHVHGLEYDEILLYVSKRTQNMFKNASQKMAEKNITPLSKLEEMVNQSPTKNSEAKQEYAVFSTLFIALSRSINRVHLYFDGSKKILNSDNTKAPNKDFLSWVKYQCHEQIELAVASSTPDEWLIFINKLIDTGDTVMIEIAKSHLMSQFTLSDDIIGQYVDDYVSQLSSLPVTDGLKWIQEQHKLNISKTSQKKIAAETEHKSENKESQKQIRKGRADEKEAIKSTSYASEDWLKLMTKQERYLLGLWNTFNVMNIEKLFEHKLFQKLLFSTLLPAKENSYNGDRYLDDSTLFDNILMSKDKLDMLVQSLKKNKNKVVFKDFISSFKSILKTKNYCDDFRLETDDGVRVHRSVQCRSLIFHFWLELTAGIDDDSKSNVLTRNDVIPEKQVTWFILDAIENKHFLDVLASDVALRLIDGYDFAHALFGYFTFIEETQVQTHFFFKLFNDKDGFIVLKKWIDKFGDYPDMIPVAERLIEMEELSPEHDAIKSRILLQSCSLLFSKIEADPENAAEIIKDISLLIENQDVIDMICENLTFKQVMINLKLSTDKDVSNTATHIMQKCVNAYRNSQSMFLPILNDLLAVLSQNNDQELQLKTLKQLDSICSSYTDIGIIDANEIMPSLMPFFQSNDINTQLVLSVLQVLSKRKENHHFFINMQLPETLVALMVHKEREIRILSARILLSLIAQDSVDVCQNVSTKALLLSLTLLHDRNNTCHISLLTILQCYPLEKFTTDDVCKKLQTCVYICFLNSRDYRVIYYCLKTLNLMVAANFKPIDLETRVLSKLLSLSSHSNKEIVGLVEPIMRFVKTHNGNAAKLDQINIGTTSTSTYLTMHDSPYRMFSGASLSQQSSATEAVAQTRPCSHPAT